MILSMFMLGIILLVDWFLISANASDTYGDLTNVEYVRNYDGDTITVNIKGIHPLIGSYIGIRINGIDTPEVKSQCQKEKVLAHSAKIFIEDILKDSKNITLKNVNRDKYFRILADVYVDGVNLSDLLIINGMAVPYNGGTKIDWCKE